MSHWVRIEPTRRQVAVAGRVTDALSSAALGGAQVQITDAPAPFVERLAVQARLAGGRDAALANYFAVLDDVTATAADRLAAAQAILDYLAPRGRSSGQRLDRTRSAADGLFYFLDLPDGDYTLVVSLPAAARRYGQAQVTATVSRDSHGTIQMVAADVALPPTALEGTITAEEPISMAAVRILGSGERTWSDASGYYAFGGLEPGLRTVEFASSGYGIVAETVSLVQGTVQRLDLDLIEPAPVAGSRLWLCTGTLAGLAAGAPVDHWPDRSDHHADLAQADSVRQPTYQPGVANGHAIVRFDGSDDYLAHNLNTDVAWRGDFSLFVVVAARSLGQPSGAALFASRQRFGGGRSLNTFDVETNGADPGRYRLRTTSNTYNIAEIVADFLLLGVIHAGNRLNLYADGVRTRRSPVDATEAKRFDDYLVGASRIGDAFFDGDIAEIILYDRGLTDDERVHVETYLSNRFAIPLA